MKAYTLLNGRLLVQPLAHSALRWTATGKRGRWFAVGVPGFLVAVSLGSIRFNPLEVML